MIRPLQDGFRPGFQQPADVRNRGQDEIPVASVNLIQTNMRIVDSNVAAFPQELLQQRNHGTFPQIVGVFLERESNYADPLSRKVQDLLNSPVQVSLVGI